MKPFKRYYVREIGDKEGYLYGVFEYESIKDKPLVRLSRPTLLATFKHENRAIKFMKQKEKEQNNDGE